MPTGDRGFLDIRAADASILSVSTVPVGRSGMPDRLPVDAGAVLAAAVHAAAKGAWEAATRIHGTLAARKYAIDSCATERAEEILERAPISTRVVAGEGSAEGMPGAFVGQMLGRDLARSDNRDRHWDAVFDYVDGTTLAARGLPGALSLGALGHGVRPVPDLQAYMVLVPANAPFPVDILSQPEEHALTVLRQATAGKNWSEVRVLTHSRDTGSFHDPLIKLLRDSGVGEVIVPDPVVIEAPYVLSLVGLSEPRIDAMIGVFGFPELAYAAMLLDLLVPDYRFVFRPASWRAVQTPGTTLGTLFDFSYEELATLAEFGWDPGSQYTSWDLVPPGSAQHAAMFAVTPNEQLGLPGPLCNGDVVTITGLMISRAGDVARLDVKSSVVLGTCGT